MRQRNQKPLVLSPAWGSSLWQARARSAAATGAVYLSWLEMLLNVLFSDVPIEFTAATITIEIPAAISAYSIAVGRRHHLRSIGPASPSATPQSYLS